MYNKIKEYKYWQLTSLSFFWYRKVTNKRSSLGLQKYKKSPLAYCKFVAPSAATQGMKNCVITWSLGFYREIISIPTCIVQVASTWGLNLNHQSYRYPVFKSSITEVAMKSGKICFFRSSEFQNWILKSSVKVSQSKTRGDLLLVWMCSHNASNNKLLTI